MFYCFELNRIVSISETRRKFFKWNHSLPFDEFSFLCTDPNPRKISIEVIGISHGLLYGATSTITDCACFSLKLLYKLAITSAKFLVGNWKRLVFR